MFEQKKLENIGIEVIDKFEDEEIIRLAYKVTDKIVQAFPNNNLNYLNIYKTLLDTPMYYAKISKGLSHVNYYYKNSSIYFSEDTNIEKIDEFIIHECIHKLQEHKDKKGNLVRLGMCEVNELTVKATALNEGAIQYITTKVFDMPTNMLTIYNIIIPGKTEYYPMITNIVSQLAFILGEEILIDSTLNGNEEFKIKIIDELGESKYKVIEKNLNDILQIKANIYELKKKSESEEKIQENINTIRKKYFETQDTIYKAYFDDMLKRTENEIEIDMVKQKLDEYKNIIGVADDYNTFSYYCEEFEKRANRKKQEIKNKQALVVVNNSVIFRFLNKIRGLFTKQKNEYYK